MRLCVMGCPRYYDITVRKWLDNHYGQDMSMDIATDFIDGNDYNESEILDLVDWLTEYCDENWLELDVVYGGRDKNDMNYIKLCPAYRGA